MKVLLAYLCHYKDRHDYYISMMPVGLLAIAAYLEKKGYDVTLANFSKMGYRKALGCILEIKPDVIGLSLFTHNRVETLKLVKEVKKALPETIIVLGGPHATFLAEEIIKRYRGVDYIIQGEGEVSLHNLLNNIKNSNKPVNKILHSKIIQNIDDLPGQGAFSGSLIGIDPREQFSFIITSRGCPHFCVFCSSPQFWQKRTRFRSPQNIIDEIQYLYENHGIIYFSVRDDNFTLDKKRVLKFARLLQQSNMFIMWNCQARVDTVDDEMLIAMKRAGLEHIQYGVESGSEKILKRYDKHTSLKKIEQAAAATRRVGVYLSIYLMSGMIGEQDNDIKATKTLIHKILPNDGIVSPVALYPGTELYEQAKKKRLVSDAIWFNKNDSGIFLRDDAQAKKWMDELLTALGEIQKKSQYRQEDFKKHRQMVGDDCWVTDILEGDYYFNNNRYSDAKRCYQRVTDRYPQNPWGFLRMAGLQQTKKI
jgi:radical SAM superfamily enzyme YgiQ (UPF0313 family)